MPCRLITPHPLPAGRRRVLCAAGAPGGPPRGNRLWVRYTNRKKPLVAGAQFTGVVANPSSRHPVSQASRRAVMLSTHRGEGRTPLRWWMEGPCPLPESLSSSHKYPQGGRLAGGCGSDTERTHQALSLGQMTELLDGRYGGGPAIMTKKSLAIVKYRILRFRSRKEMEPVPAIN